MSDRSFPRWFPWWMAFVYGIAGAALVGITMGPKQPEGPPPVLPNSAVEGKQESSAEMAVRLADNQALMAAMEERHGLQVDALTGELRNRDGTIANLRSQIAIDTGPVKPPAPEVVALHIREACDEPESIDPVGRGFANICAAVARRIAP